MLQQRNHNFLLSADPSIAVQEVMDSISVLREIYVQETDALVDANTRSFLALQEPKFEAARTYQLGIEELLKRKKELQSISPVKKEQLTQMQREFSVLADQNKEALERMQRCMNRIGDIIRRTAKDAVNKQRGVRYGECGNIQSAYHKSVSMSVDERA